MKYVIGSLIFVTVVLSFSAKARTCEEVWSDNPQSKSDTFLAVSESQPGLAQEVKEESIKLCEKTVAVGAMGVDVNVVLGMVNRSIAGKNIPEEGKLSMGFMAVSGWQIGRDNMKNKGA